MVLSQPKVVEKKEEAPPEIADQDIVMDDPEEPVDEPGEVPV